MFKHDRSSSFKSLDCGSHSIEGTVAFQLFLHVFVLGREACTLPEFALKNFSQSM